MKILVEHEVPYCVDRPNKCYEAGDFWGHDMCPYLKYRDRNHGPRKPIERRLPKCTLFDVWLDGDNKCPECVKACEKSKAAKQASHADEIHAYWKPDCYGEHYCTNCGCYARYEFETGCENLSDYCGDCGAKMDERMK